MVEVGRDLWRSSCPTHLLKQGHLETVTQDHVQTAFEYLQGGRLQPPSSATCVSACSPSEWKSFPNIQTQPPVFQFVRNASGLVAGHRYKECGALLFALSLQVFICLDKIPPW